MELLQALQALGRMAEENAEDGLGDREGLLENFRAARETARLVGLKMRTSLVDETPRVSLALPPNLRPILLRELTVGRKHHGRILFGKLIEVPFKLTSIMTILEDSAGDAVAVAIYHAVDTYASRSTVENLYPQGMSVAVQEPYMKVGNDGRLVVRVDKPEDIIDCDPVKDDTSGECVESLREEGKRYFSEGQWYRAMVAFTRCIRLLEAKLDGAEGADLGSPTVSDQCSIVYSNRAEAWLRMDHHANALHDAVKALEHDASHTKSMVRKVRALCGLQCYREAIACLREMLKRKSSLHPQTRSELKDILKEAEVGDKQSRLGIFNLNGYYRSGTKASAPVCTDYVGPVEVKMVPSENPAAGRGLFATKQVKAGDLLGVSNALAVATGDPKESDDCHYAEGSERATRVCSNTTEELIRKLVELCRRYPRRKLQLYALSDTPGGSRCEVPPMSLFTPPVDSTQVIATTAELNTRAEVDISRIRRVVKINAFQGDEPEGPDMVTPWGLWLLPSFVNHSCMPNAKCSVVGDTLFLRAIRGISKGEEITILYCCGQQPVHERGRTYRSHFHFECECKRCSFERNLNSRFPRLVNLATELANLPPKDVDLSDEATSELAAEGAKIAVEVEEILQEVPELDAGKKDWVRASFLRAYMCQVSEQMLVAMKTCGWDSWAEAMSARFDIMLSIVPDEEVLAHIAGAIHHLPVAQNWRTQWTSLAKRICTLMYGPLEEATLTAVLKRYSRVSLPL